VIDNKNRNQEEAKSIQVAEESRELDWKSKSFMASMFMGDLDMGLAFPFPIQSEEDRKEGDAIIEKFDAWAKDNLDGDAIDKAQEIPPHVWKGIADLGLFGIKIPKEYGGLGLSQTNYVRILGAVARYCGSTAATLSAHQSIGVPQPLKLFGTEEQKKKWLPRIAKGELSAFALTEPGAGSDPASMVTEAVKQEDGSWVINGEKLWCTNGTLADLYVVMARTTSADGRKGITAFVVEGRSEGLEVVHRCRFLGIRAIENGLIRFRNVRVPAENVILGEGKGLKLALTTLNDGRLGIPAVAAFVSKDVLDFSASWAKCRVQWGKSVGDHEAGAQKLADIAGLTYAMETLALYGAALSDKHNVDIRMEAATAKMWNSERSWEVADTAFQLRGGRGFETDRSVDGRGEVGFPMERVLRDTRINRIVEGTTDIMHLFIAREALDGHLRNAGGLFKKGATLLDKLKVIGKCALIYPKWYIGNIFGSIFDKFIDFDDPFISHLNWIESKTRKLALTLFHQMLLKGPKLEMRQLILARIVDIGAELAVMALTVSRIQTEERVGSGFKVSPNRAVVEHFLLSRRKVVDRLFEDVWSNTDESASRTAKAVMDSVTEFPASEKADLPAIDRKFCSDYTTRKDSA
jgi:alkylation response protein AidB-like acyl-CoA dehydrogenase